MILPSEFNVRWHMQFKDINDDTYHLCIYDKNYNGVVQTLRGGATPFVIEEDDDDDVFLPIRTQTGMITFVDSGTIVEQMLSDTPLNRPVILYKGATKPGNEQWTGFLSCESMSQPYADSIHTVSVGVQCPLATLQGIEIDQPQNGLGFVNLNILLHEALGHVYDTDVKEQPYEDWGSGAWQYYVVRDYWLERVDYDSTIQKPYTGKTYYDVFTDIFMYFGLQARMHNGDVYITKTDCADFGNDIITPEWMGTGHEQNFLAGVRKITQECVPDEADTQLIGIPEDVSHKYEDGPHRDVNAITATEASYTEEWYCPPGFTNENWYAYTYGSYPVPPISKHMRTGAIMSGGLFMEYDQETVIGALPLGHDLHPTKGMMFGINGGLAFHFDSVESVISSSDRDMLRIQMRGGFIRAPRYELELHNDLNLPAQIRFYVRFGNLWLKRENPGSGSSSSGYSWVNDSSAYYYASIDANGRLCSLLSSGNLSYSDDIVVQLPHGCEKLTVNIEAPRQTKGYFQFYFATSFSVSIDTMDKQKRHRHILRYDLGNAFSDTVDMELPLACNLSQVPYTHGYIFRKDPQGEYLIISDYYENDLFERLKNYHSTRHHTLVITVSIDDYRPDYGVVINGVIYAVLAHTYDYINATVTLKLINIPQPE